MNVDTGSFENLAAQVRQMAAEVARLAAREAGLEVMYKAGLEHGRELERNALLGRAAESRTHARLSGTRPRHLHLLGDGAS